MNWEPKFGPYAKNVESVVHSVHEFGDDMLVAVNDSVVVGPNGEDYNGLNFFIESEKGREHVAISDGGIMNDSFFSKTNGFVQGTIHGQYRLPGLKKPEETGVKNWGLY